MTEKISPTQVSTLKWFAAQTEPMSTTDLLRAFDTDGHTHAPTFATVRACDRNGWIARDDWDHSAKPRYVRYRITSKGRQVIETPGT